LNLDKIIKNDYIYLLLIYYFDKSIFAELFIIFILSEYNLRVYIFTNISNNSIYLILVILLFLKSNIKLFIYLNIDKTIINYYIYLSSNYYFYKSIIAELFILFIFILSKSN